MSDITTARVRGATRPKQSEGIDGPVGQLPGGELLVANAFPGKTESVRLGDVWSCQIATGSAYTNVATYPTTLANLALRNGEPGGGKSYIIDSIWFLSLTTIGALTNTTIIYQLQNAVALTDDPLQLITSPLGKTYGGRATRACAVTTMVANKWAAVAAATCGATATIGFGCVANIDGGIIVTPGMTLGINAVLGTAAGTSLMGLSWREEVLAPF